MSLESSIAALTAQAGLLLDLPQQIQTAALQRQAEITNTYNDRLARLETTFYVNHLTGLDTNAGTAAGVPLKTIQRALDLTPRGGRCTCFLQSDIPLAADVTLQDQVLFLRPAGAGIVTITPTGRLNTAVSPALREINGFRFVGRSAVQMLSVNLAIPAVGSDNVYARSDSVGAVFRQLDAIATGTVLVHLGACTITMPASPYGKLFSASNLILFSYFGLTVTGSTLPGRVLAGYDDTASGTPTKDIPFFLSHLPAV